jgi:hypothetical protein
VLGDAAALATVKHWRFSPARKGGEALEAWVLVPIVFRLEPVDDAVGCRHAAKPSAFDHHGLPRPGCCGRRVSGPLGPSFLGY